MLAHFVRKARSEFLILVVALMSVYPVSRRLSAEHYSVLLSTRVSVASMMEESLAAAFGAGVRPGPYASAVVDIGSGTNQCCHRCKWRHRSRALRADGSSILILRLLTMYVVTGDYIGVRSAERLKLEVVQRLFQQTSPEITVRGRDVLTGAPAHPDYGRRNLSCGPVCG